MKLLPFVIAAGVLQLLNLRAAAQNPSNPDSPSTDMPVDRAPDTTLKPQGGSVAAGIGSVWGHGTVNTREMIVDLASTEYLFLMSAGPRYQRQVSSCTRRDYPTLRERMSRGARQLPWQGAVLPRT
jgi:hypothetical protein